MCNCNGCEQAKKVKGALETLVSELKEVAKKGVPYIKKIADNVEAELNRSE